MPKHRSEAPPRGFPGRARGLTAAAVSTAIGLVVYALIGVGGSYAMWTVSDTLDGGTIETGTVGLTAAWGSAHDDEVWGNLLPEEAERRSFTLTNSGDVRLEVAATLTSGSDGFELRVTPGECGSERLDTASLDDTPSSFGAVEAGDSAMGCLEVRLTETALPGQRADFVVRFDGEQVGP